MFTISRRVKFLILLVWLTAWLPAASAQAAFHLDMDEGDGISLARQHHVPTAYYATNRVPARGAAQDRPAPAQVVSGGCYTEPGTPPASVMQNESGGDPTVWNREGSSASGCWQIIESTWAGYGGYPNAASAPVHVQNAKAKELWADTPCHWRATTSLC